METGLHLLTRDGAVRVAFHPRLTADQYAQLMAIVESPAAATKDGLCAALERVAKAWGNRIEIEEGALDLLRK